MKNFDDETSVFFTEIKELIASLIPEIGDEYRATDDPPDAEPGMDITVSTQRALRTWSYQTGDNSYTGSCYGDPYWATGTIYRDTDPHTLACDLLEQLSEAWHDDPENDPAEQAAAYGDFLHDQQKDGDL